MSRERSEDFKGFEHSFKKSRYKGQNFDKRKQADELKEEDPESAAILEYEIKRDYYNQHPEQGKKLDLVLDIGSEYEKSPKVIRERVRNIPRTEFGELIRMAEQWNFSVQRSIESWLEKLKGDTNLLKLNPIIADDPERAEEILGMALILLNKREQLYQLSLAINILKQTFSESAENRIPLLGRIETEKYAFDDQIREICEIGNDSLGKERAESLKEIPLQYHDNHWWYMVSPSEKPKIETALPLQQKLIDWYRKLRDHEQLYLKLQRDVSEYEPPVLKLTAKEFLEFDKLPNRNKLLPFIMDKTQDQFQYPKHIRLPGTEEEEHERQRFEQMTVRELIGEYYSVEIPKNCTDEELDELLFFGKHRKNT